MTATLHRFALIALSLALALGALLAPTESRAQPAAQSVGLTVTVILASQDGSGVEAGLAPHADRLKKQFGAQFDGFRLASRESFRLEVGKEARAIPIPGADPARIAFLGMQAGAYRLQVSVPGGSTNVTSPRGGLFFVGGPRVSGGTLILAIQTNE